MEFNLLIGAEAGQGAFSVELSLTEILSRLNYHFFATKNYMSRVRGGHNFHMIRIADHPVHALAGLPWDMVVALDEETERRHKPTLREGGIYLPRSQMLEVEKEAKDQFHDVTAGNEILVGIILSIIAAGSAALAESAAPERLPHLRKGFEIASRWQLAGKYPITASASCHCIFDGNQAIALGALLGGCQFLSGYPMTPATSIMHYFSTAARSMAAHFEQAEDEISAINMALGASYAGVRSMTATSGGGFALMQEGVSLAGMTETPIVIAVSQRPGPATGLPTRTEQGDLDFVVHAGHGEFPRIVFAPGTIPETIELSSRAFDLADRYQIPVFILTDQYFADSVQVVEESIPQERVPKREYAVHGREYQRYALTEDGVSPMACPGLSDAMVRFDSDEHDEEGKITEDLDLRVRMVDKRRGKTALLRAEARAPSLFGPKDSKWIVLSWGSNRLIVEEAVARLASEGMEIASLHFGQVYPLSAEMIAPYGLDAKVLVCVENNAAGQFARLFQQELGLPVAHRILKYDGTCFTVEELFSRLKGLLS